MDAPSARIRELMQTNPSETVNAFATRCNVAPSNFWRMLKGTQTITDGTLKKIADATGASFWWLKEGSGEMYATRAVYADKPAPGSVPYYDEDFMCGFTLRAEGGHESVAAWVTVPGYASATVWCNVSGKSMEPEICPGDMVALQRVEDFSFLPFEYVYAIVTANGMRTVKRLGPSPSPDCYRLIPTNKAYPEQDLPKDKIMHVFRVLGTVRSFG